MKIYASSKWKQRLGFCAVAKCRKRSSFFGETRGLDQQDRPVGKPVSIRWCGRHMSEAFDLLASLADEITATVEKRVRLK